MAARHKARKRALDVLYAAELRGEEPLAALARIEEDSGGFPNPYTEVVVRGVVAESGPIDELIAHHARGWSIERMPAVDRNVLRIGAWELLHAGQYDVPRQVAVAEAVQLVRELSTDDSPDFVNGVLGAIQRSLADPAG